VADVYAGGNLKQPLGQVSAEAWGAGGEYKDGH
jgi:hypothetical protein